MAAIHPKQQLDEDPLSFKAPLPASSLPAMRPNPSDIPGSGPGQTQMPSASAPVMGFIGVGASDVSVAQGAFEGASQRAREMWASARPWREYFEVSELSLPKFSQVTDRVEANASLFRGNYELIAAAWVAFGLFMALGSFLVAGLLLLCVERWVRFKVQNEGALDFSEKALASIAVLVIVWVTGIGRDVVEAFALAAASIALHAVLRNPPEADVEIGEIQ